MDTLVIAGLVIAHVLLLATMAYVIVDVLTRNKKLKEKNFILEKELKLSKELYDSACEEVRLCKVAEREQRLRYGAEALRKSMLIHSLEVNSTELANRILLMQCTPKKKYVPIFRHGLSSWELLSRFSEL